MNLIGASQIMNCIRKVGVQANGLSITVYCRFAFIVCRYVVVVITFYKPKLTLVEVQFDLSHLIVWPEILAAYINFVDPFIRLIKRKRVFDILCVVIFDLPLNLSNQLLLIGSNGSYLLTCKVFVIFLHLCNINSMKV